MQRVIGLALIIFLLPIQLLAAESLIDAYAAARDFDPRFRGARYDYEAAREKIPQAKR